MIVTVTHDYQASTCPRADHYYRLRDSRVAPLRIGYHRKGTRGLRPAGGIFVETVVHEGRNFVEIKHMFGANAMDLSLRPPAAWAGYDQGRALAEQRIPGRRPIAVQCGSGGFLHCGTAGFGPLR